MIRLLICKLFGHIWQEHDGWRYCGRCGTISENHKPVSTLDEIVNDKRWYKPRDMKKERKK